MPTYPPTSQGSGNHAMGILGEPPADIHEHIMPRDAMANAQAPTAWIATPEWVEVAPDGIPGYALEAETGPEPSKEQTRQANPADVPMRHHALTPAGFTSAQTRAAKLAALAMQGNAIKPSGMLPVPATPDASTRQPRAAATDTTADHAAADQRHHKGAHPPRRIGADDFTAVFGKPGEENPVNIHALAQTFRQAWQDDGDVLRYDGAQPVEADAPPGKTSRAASGWQPLAQEQAIQAAFPAPPRTIDGTLSGNELFEAYGASYAEAYAVAVALEFSEEKPVPDDNIGDVTGPVDSILHTPGGSPINLGTMMPGDAEPRESKETATDADWPDRPLTRGRKVLRYGLLALAAVVVLASGLYFTGYLR